MVERTVAHAGRPAQASPWSTWPLATWGTPRTTLKNPPRAICGTLPLARPEEDRVGGAEPSVTELERAEDALGDGMDCGRQAVEDGVGLVEPPAQGEAGSHANVAVGSFSFHVLRSIMPPQGGA